MKSYVKASLATLAVSALFATSASAGWVLEDGTPYTSDCCKAQVVKRVKRIKRVKKASEFCETCDYSRFPMAEVMPLEPGERLAPARLGNCGMK